jgi:hypothetical protein
VRDTYGSKNCFQRRIRADACGTWAGLATATTSSPESLRRCARQAQTATVGRVERLKACFTTEPSRIKEERCV